jgi:hypothetical protein
MKWFFLAIALAGMGCDGTVVATGCEDITIGANELIVTPTDGKSTDCRPTIYEFRNTRVLSEEFGVLVVKCSYCDEEGCNHLGARCEVEGRYCDFRGDLGVCQPCCDSEYGELHCGPIPP